jgi:hypothetical protein
MFRAPQTTLAPASPVTTLKRFQVERGIPAVKRRLMAERRPKDRRSSNIE